MPGTQTRLAEFVPYRMAITSGAVSQAIANEYRMQFGLKISEWRVMAVLGDAGPLTQRDLVRATQMDKVAVNRACKVLEDRALVQRSPNVADGRSHHLELTTQGRDIHAQIWPQALEIYEEIFSALTPRETEKLRALLDKLLGAVRRFESRVK
ncbi:MULTISPECIES: MarR family winged helix-turn-helix transcriptional regulator [unclassified Novosphingobium]|uniref:MarR family winged helix-turn-helix transcriptional regulator n=2 Tax=Novosphingobium TaxID=165696 RepID=UPI001446A858|nr:MULTISPECIES: MarR family winged helix-turn-helix transcriptional regulator [unclassified Novosphingobium]NMN03230.1 DNA-binding MarR family transcriptional regulator [Novosphingobium sp. SG919]NMN86780.1 DNA-binding MarR family transcriptional regulator [Novosphingobium sp. SG916]